MPMFAQPSLARNIAGAIAGVVILSGLGVAVKIVGNTPKGNLAGGSGSVLQIWSSSGAQVATMTASGSLTLSGSLKIQRSLDIGWKFVDSANQACNTTCTFGCVFGEDTGVIGTLVLCTDATADHCLCAGPN